MIRRIMNVTVFIVLMAIAAPLSVDAYNTLTPPLRSEMEPPHIVAPQPKEKEQPRESTAAFVANLSVQYKERVLSVLNNNSTLSGTSSNNALSRNVSATIDAKAAVLLSKAALATTPAELAKIKAQAELLFPISKPIAG